MTLPAKAFDGASFFQSIRANMDSNSGLTGGNDNGMQFVVMDATFYNFEVFLRKSGSTFKTSALGLDQMVRVVTSAGFVHEYNKVYGTDAVPWEGEVIIRGIRQSGGYCKPEYQKLGGCYTPYPFIGIEKDGISIRRYKVSKNDPSKITPKLEFAHGYMLPLILGRLRAVPVSEAGDPPKRGVFPSPSMEDWYKRPPETGKAGVGIHRTSNCIFVFCQRHDDSSGMGIRTLIDRMMKMGVDDAVLGDGSDSTCLFVDKILHVDNASWNDYKNRSLMTGFAFRIRPLNSSKGTFAISSSTDPTLLFRFQSSGVNCTIKAATTPSALKMEIASLGQVTTGPSSGRDAGSLLGITPFPVILTSPNTDLASGVSFTSVPKPEFKMEISKLKLSVSSSGKDQLVGILKVTNVRGIIVGDLVVDF